MCGYSISILLNLNKIMNDITKVGGTINAKESMTSLEIAEVTGKK